MTTAYVTANEAAVSCRPALRILFLTDAFLPHAGGARTYYYSLLRELARQPSNRITVLTKKVPGWREFDQSEASRGLRILRSGRPLENWKYHQLPRIVAPVLRVLPLLAAQRFDLVHFGDLYPQGALSLGLKRVFGIPYVAYCHGEEITQTDLRRYQPKVRDAIFRGAEVVIAANEFARQNLIRIGIPADRIRKLTPGVDYVKFKPAPPSTGLLDRHALHGRKVLLTVGRLVPRKGHALVLEAMRRLTVEFPELTYLIVGTGPEETDLRRLVSEWNLTRFVQFAGKVAEQDLPDYYNAADLFVLPNFDDHGDLEGFGMVFLEANACGKAVVGAHSGGAAEAVLDGVTGMLVPPRDVESLISTVQLLLRNDELRISLGGQGLNRTRSDFTWESRARELDEMNREIVARRSKRAGRSASTAAGWY